MPIRKGVREMSEFLSVTQYAEKYSLDVGNVRKLIAKERIPAIKIGNQWAIPADTPRPDDKRVKTGKYKDWRKKESES